MVLGERAGPANGGNSKNVEKKIILSFRRSQLFLGFISFHLHDNIIKKGPPFSICYRRLNGSQRIFYLFSTNVNSRFGSFVCIRMLSVVEFRITQAGP